MGNTNSAAANLQAGEAQIEQDIAGLGTAITKEIKDAQDTIAADLAKAGVDPAVVQGVADKLTALHTTVTALTTQVAAGDPGEPDAPPTPPAAS